MERQVCWHSLVVGGGAVGVILQEGRPAPLPADHLTDLVILAPLEARRPTRGLDEGKKGKGMFMGESLCLACHPACEQSEITDAKIILLLSILYIATL